MDINNLITIKTKNAEVFVGNEVFSVLDEYLRPYRDNKIFILVDENSFQYCVTELITRTEFLNNAEIIEINSGEENKTIAICFEIWKTLANFKADRNSLLINLGGGVITDMGGFIASTYKRGIDFINIPTTLLSQIDASIGGKVGINFESLKNLVGVFNEPKGVFIYPDFLKTLDKKQMLSGYAEALKHALIKDETYWKKLKQGMLSNAKDWLALIATSIEIKNKIILKDPFEKNNRKLLNFGHTIGHAIESYSLRNEESPLCHGEAVAIGLICEAYISSKLLDLSNLDLKSIVKTITNYFQHYPLQEKKYHQLIELMKNDKKNESDKINFTLLSAIGVAHINQEVEVETILEALNFYNSLAIVKKPN